MPQSPKFAGMSSFNKGLKTEFTGLNFPEDAAFDTQNCIFNRIGNVTRRPGIDYETNFTQQTINRTSLAINTYRWNNVGGDGSTRVLVTQVGTILRFYKTSSATIASPLSTQILASTVDVSTFVSTGGSFNSTKECQFTDGNGYLFVFHPSCDPFYVVYTFGSPDTVAGTVINVKIRDVQGILETVDDGFRPSSLTTEHQYNLQNQGWTNAPSWSGTSSTSNSTSTGSHTWTIQTGLTISNGQIVTVTSYALPHNYLSSETGTVTSYNSGTGALVLNITSTSLAGFVTTIWTFASYASSKITSWNTGAVSVGGYPSNADVWWAFKDSSNLFNPATTVSNVTLNSGPAPKGFYILNAFQQLRSIVSGVTGITDITTTVRPKTGVWFAGRVWYAGTDAQQNATGDAPNYTWTENLYFSQIIEREDQFGKCYQRNDPTSETLFDLLPNDGGTLKIQGCGSIYKLFPFQNGLIVFAANGVWFITGSQGIGFTANDFTISRLSTVQSISSTSIVDVQGVPMWWNEEAIYTISMSSDQGGTSYGPTRGALGNGNISVQPITYSSIQSFYDNIPVQSKKYVRGDYDSINWEVKWIYRTTNESSTTDRYQFDGVLTYNTITQSFSPWFMSTTAGVPYVHGINYIQGPGGSTSPLPILKYLSSVAIAGPSYKFTFAEEKDVTLWKDWHSSTIDYDFNSFFVTGFMVHGKALHKFQDQYIVMYLNNTTNGSYRMQGIWDYAINRNSNRFTALELTSINDDPNNFGVAFRRHRIRGRGYAVQFKVISVSGQPFDVIGWTVDERINTGI